MDYAELSKLASKNNFSTIIEEMCDNSSIISWLPEFFWMDNYIHNEIYHPEGNPLDHTLAALKVADKLEYNSLTKISVLFHDIGKSVTAINYRPDRPYHNFVHHETAGLNVFYCICNRLHIPRKDSSIIGYCIRNHMRVYRFDRMKEHKIIETVLSPYWDVLKKVCWADCASKGEGFNKDELKNHFNYGERLAKNVYHIA